MLINIKDSSKDFHLENCHTFQLFLSMIRTSDSFNSSTPRYNTIVPTVRCTISFTIRATSLSASQRFHISQSQIRHYIRLLSIIHIHSCYQSKRNNQSCLQNILLHLILGKNSTAEKTKIPLAYSDYLHYFYIGLNLLFF